MRALLFVVALLCAPGALGAPPEVLTLKRAVELGLEGNPELLSLAADVKGAEARLAGASLLAQTNPTLSADLGPRWAPDRQLLDYGVEVSQELEIYGTRRARIDGASANQSMTVARLKARRVEIAAAIRGAFARALAAEQRYSVSREMLELSRQVAAAAARKYELGSGSRIDLNTARVEVARAAQELSTSIRARDAAFAELRLLLALEPTTELRLEDSPASPPAIAADDGALVTKALATRADLVAAKHAIELATADQRFAAREWIPRPRIGARYEREEGDQVFRGMLQLDLPAFNQNQAQRGVAAAQLMQAERAAEAVERRVRQEVLLAAMRLRSAQEAAQAFEHDVIAAMDDNLTLVGTAYQVGKLTLFEALVLRRNTLEARRGYIDAQEQLRTAQAQMLEALGMEE